MQQDLTQGSIRAGLIRFSLPLIAGNLLQQLYNVADTLIVGRFLGNVALAAVGSAFSLMILLTSLILGLCMGSGVVFSQLYGEGNTENLKTAMTNAFCLIAALSLLLMALSYALLNAFISLLRVPQEAVPDITSYLLVIFAGIFFTFLYNFFAAVLRSVGNSFAPLLFLLLSTVVNIALDLLFMGPLDLGVGGAAAATVLAQGISAALGLFYILRREPDLHFGRNALRVPCGFVPDMFFTGLSMALMSAIYSIGSVILHGSINALGNVYIAAQVGGRRLAELFYMPGVALGASVATYSSQNFGANRRRRIVQGQWVALAIYGVWWLFALAFTFTAAPAAIRLITGSTNPDVLENALLYLHVSIPMVPPMAVVVIVRNALQGMKHTVAPLICSTMELVCKAFFSFKLVPMLGYPAVCACEPVAWVICMVFILAAAYAFRNDFNDTQEVRT